jgi:hypothetical protein
VSDVLLIIMLLAAAPAFGMGYLMRSAERADLISHLDVRQVDDPTAPGCFVGTVFYAIGAVIAATPFGVALVGDAHRRSIWIAMIVIVNLVIGVLVFGIPRFARTT